MWDCAAFTWPAEQRTPRRVVDLLDPWIKEELEKPDRPGLGKWTPPRLFTVGRLDVQTQGLIFVTNNGEGFAHDHQGELVGGQPCG